MSSDRTAVIAFVFIIGSVAGTQVHAANDVALTKAVADSETSITVAVPQHVMGLAPLPQLASTENELWQFPGRSGRGARCQSKKKGALVGAAIGGVAGVAFALYVNRQLGGANSANRFLVYSTAGGAGAGALVGFAYCR